MKKWEIGGKATQRNEEWIAGGAQKKYRLCAFGREGGKRKPILSGEKNCGSFVQKHQKIHINKTKKKRGVFFVPYLLLWILEGNGARPHKKKKWIRLPRNALRGRFDTKRYCVRAFLLFFCCFSCCFFFFLSGLESAKRLGFRAVCIFFIAQEKKKSKDDVYRCFPPPLRKFLDKMALSAL